MPENFPQETEGLVPGNMWLSLHHGFPNAPPCFPPCSLHMHEFWYSVRPGSYRGHMETGTDLVLGNLTLRAHPLRSPVNTHGRNKETPLREHSHPWDSGLGILRRRACTYTPNNYACPQPGRVCTKCWGALPRVYSCPRHRERVATRKHCG